jgi:1H-pyrrole-2-carbonyl-[peptidyl-carrier protein] chlorinase
MAETTDFDVAIIGGGPAGSAMGAYLGRAGLDTVVLERELFPRPHVGESLVPSSTRVFRDLDLLPKMEAHRFPHKYGAAWTAANASNFYQTDWAGLQGEDYADFQFSEREQEGVAMDYTYHVDRGKFDLMMLQHAHELGATVWEGVRVPGVDFSGETPEVAYTVGKKEAKFSARMVVDASGRNTLIGDQEGWKIKDPVFDQFALHTWFDGYDRGTVAKEGREDYIYIHFLPVSNTWVWQIPITDTITSIGVVTQKRHFARRKSDQEEFFWTNLETRPDFAGALRDATQLRPLKTEGDYSYAMTQIVGDRIMLIGDAGRFVDPIFSTGVSIAMNSARFASFDVIAAFEKGDFSKGAFSNFETTIRQGTKNWYDFITVYYRLNVLFTAFVAHPKYRLDVLKLLQGDVYDDASPPVLEKMRNIVTAVESNPDHVWHSLLNELTNDAFRPTF